MSFAAIEVPPHRSLTKKPKKSILTDAELEQIVAMLHQRQTPSDGVVYTEPTKSGKQGPRTVAYLTGYGVRGEVLAGRNVDEVDAGAAKSAHHRQRVIVAEAAVHPVGR